MKMQISRKKKLLATVIISVLTFTIALPLMTVDAHTPPWYLTTYMYIHTAPNPVGVGQKVYFMFWIVMPIPTAAGDTGDRWHDITINVTKPDGAVVKMGPYALPGPGLTGDVFLQTQEVGTYNVSMYFPGQTVQLAGYTGKTSAAGPTFTAYVNDTWSPATATSSFTVTEEALQYEPAVPIPVSYWTRPIDDNNFQNWYAIASPWLGAATTNQLSGAIYWKYQQYGLGPQTAHVMWTDPISWGGVVGGGNAINAMSGGWKSPYGGDQMTFYSGTQYQLKGSSPIIMYQNLYLQLPYDASQQGIGGGLACISLTTGQTLWVRQDISTAPMFGQFYDFNSVNQHGTTGTYLWVSGTALGTGIIPPSQQQLAYLNGTYPPGFFSSQGFPPGNVTLGGSGATGSFATLTPAQRSLPVNAPGSWLAIDPMTGRNDFNETNIPSGGGTVVVQGQYGTATLSTTTVNAYGPQGEWLRYSLAGGNATAGFTTLWQWNNTQLPGNELRGGITSWMPTVGSAGGGTYNPGAGNWNMSASYDFNVSLTTPSGTPTSLKPGPVNQYANQGSIQYAPQIVHVWPGDMAFGQSSNLQLLATTEAYFGTPDQYELWAINLNPTRGPVGEVMWDRLYNSVGGNSTYLIGPQDGNSHIFTIYVRETQQFYGYNMLTGDPLWGPTQSQDPFNYFTGVTALTWPSALGNGIVYNAGHSGIAYAFNMTNGQTVFVYGSNASDPFNSTRTIETAYGGYPTQIAAVTYNTVYAFAEEHSIDAPPYRSASIRAFDATTGQEKWKLFGMAPYQSGAVADGYLVFYNLMDGREYCIGPGPSATTVNAPNAGVTIGATAEITGTVTDQSPNTALKGTPAISDKDQGPWMEYMVENTITAPNATGVPVTLTVLDSNNNVVSQAKVTSNQDGIFHFPWTPTTPGEYTIHASFDGTLSYGPSSAGTAIYVAPAPSAAPTNAPTPTPTPTSTTSALPTTSPSPAVSPGNFPTMEVYIIAVAVAVIVIVAVAAVVLRRRK